MTGNPISPKVLRGGLVLLDRDGNKVIASIPMQYNPEKLTRNYEPQYFGEGQGELSRFKGPAVETLTVDAEIDAADLLEFPGQNQNAVEHGIQPQLAALEALINPTAEQLNSNNILASTGTLEIVPMEAPLALFIWSKNRIVPIQITSFSITEEAFDTQLNPINAKVSLGMRVLNVDHLGFDQKGGSLFMNYLQNKESLAAKVTDTSLDNFGIGGLP